MQKIKVLHIIKSLGRGGAEMLLPETLKLHDRSKFEFHYIYFLPWKDQMVKTIEDAGGRVTCLAANNNFKMLLKNNEVIDYCKKNKIDVMHCHLPWSGFLGRVVFAKTRIPVIYTEHNIQERYHFITKTINKITFNSQSMAIGVSEDVTNSIKNNINPKIPVKTVLNGVNTEYFKKDEKKGDAIKSKYNIPKNAIVIGNIAVFREQKNIPNWIRAFKEISNENPKVYGILVGAGPKEEEIKNLISEFGLEKNIVLAGLQTNTIDYFSAMDIFMMSSDFEGLPIALLEAMSMECAVVPTKAGGVTEAVRDKKDGVLCEVGDWQEMAKKAIDLVKDEEKRMQFQTAARKRVEESFSLSVMVGELERIYAEHFEK